MQVTHLHVYSNYSLLGGTVSVQALAERAAADGMSHLALTDSNVLIGAVAFERACRQNEIQPIVGMTLTVANPSGLGHHLDKKPGRLVLLATGPDGYRSLCRLSSMIQGSPKRAQLLAHGLDLEFLKSASDGLICLSGGRHGWIQRFLLNQERQAATRFVSRLAGIFDERFYLSLELAHSQGTGDKANASLCGELASLGERFGIATVAAQPIYTLSPSERSQMRLLAAIDQNCLLQDVPIAALPDEGDPAIDLHWPTPDELAQRYADYPDALAATQSIASQCRSALPDGQPIWPVLKSSDDGRPITNPEATLTKHAEAGLALKFSHKIEIVRSRLTTELSVINQHGYAPLFLLVSDIVSYAQSREIPVSTRGSVANSLVAYCCGITTVDPIEHDLLFERFLNPERSDPPDIDLDFCSRRRDEVLNYVRTHYGADQVALVATISTLRPRSAIRETAKAYGVEEQDIKRLTRLLPDSWHPDPRRRQRSTIDEILASLANPKEKEVIRAAYSIVGQPHHLSIHPGGLVVTPGPLTDYVPVHLAPKGFLTTQFEHGDVEAIGLPKLDLLGIRALTVLADAADLVRQHHDPSFRLAEIPAADEMTGNMMAIGDTTGVFQCESSGAKRTLRQLQVRNVGDLAVANAFFKPGPATGGLAPNFIRRYRGEEEASYLHPSLEPILGITYGVMLFQEQILRVAREIAGLTWAEADHLRRGMSKFRANEMESMRSRFVEGCVDGKCALTQKQAETLWEQVKAFAGYGFNQGHATAYADVSYRSAYIKAHWPAAFLTSRLANQGGFHHPAIYIAEAQQAGIDVRPPHINHSQRKFHLAFADRLPILWMGLGQARSLRQDSVQAIMQERTRQPFTSLRNLLSRVSLQAKEVEHLVKCGALDGLTASDVIADADGNARIDENHAQHRAALLAELGSFRRVENVQQMAFAFTQTQVEPESLYERLMWEQTILGQPISVHPLDLVSAIEPHPSLSDIQSFPGKRVETAAIALPGWTGGKGIYLGDGKSYIIGRSDDRDFKPKRWLPLLLTGRWRLDEWGGGWFQIESAQEVQHRIK